MNKKIRNFEICDKAYKMQLHRIKEIMVDHSSVYISECIYECVGKKIAQNHAIVYITKTYSQFDETDETSISEKEDSFSYILWSLELDEPIYPNKTYRLPYNYDDLDYYFQKVIMDELTEESNKEMVERCRIANTIETLIQPQYDSAMDIIQGLMEEGFTATYLPLVYPEVQYMLAETGIEVLNHGKYIKCRWDSFEKGKKEKVLYYDKDFANKEEYFNKSKISFDDIENIPTLKRSFKFMPYVSIDDFD